MISHIVSPVFFDQEGLLLRTHLTILIVLPEPVRVDLSKILGAGKRGGTSFWALFGMRFAKY
ncbi:hypothetical protein J2X69_001768 [Algoriphagus sp. 4150]|nr:hypothetical protein [Algoriphagus sp. 4150]